MKIFCDFHHGALVRFLFYLFGDRLGHEFILPSVLCNQALRSAEDGTWGCLTDEGWDNLAVPGELRAGKTRFCEYEEFMEGQFDVFILSRPESMQIFQAHGHPKKGQVYIGVSGNEGTAYNWNWIQNFIATDLRSFTGCNPEVHKIHIPQELGRHFDCGFVPIKEEDLHTVSTFTNNMGGFDIPIQIRCQKDPVNIYQIWLGMKEELPEYTLNAYGHSNDKIGGESLSDHVLPAYYHRSALTWNFKTCEGYGHSLLQSLPTGRPVIVGRGFYNDRTAGKYMIDGETCVVCEYDAKDIGSKVREHTKDLATANAFARRCYDAYHRLFDWAGDAERIREWMKPLRGSGIGEQ